MPSTQTRDETDRVQIVQLVASAFVLGLMAVLFRLMDGSWGSVARIAASALVILALYAAPVIGIAGVLLRRGRAVSAWWFLALLPVWGAVTGAGVGIVDPGPSGLRSPIIHGIAYGALHALYLRWCRQREARRAGAAAA